MAISPEDLTIQTVSSKHSSAYFHMRFSMTCCHI